LLRLLSKTKVLDLSLRPMISIFTLKLIILTWIDMILTQK